MGKVIASYLVKVTVREPDGLKAGDQVEEPITNDQLEDEIRRDLTARHAGWDVSASSERTDI